MRKDRIVNIGAKWNVVDDLHTLSKEVGGQSLITHKGKSLKMGEAFKNLDLNFEKAFNYFNIKVAPAELFLIEVKNANFELACVTIESRDKQTLKLVNRMNIVFEIKTQAVISRFEGDNEQLIDFAVKASKPESIVKIEKYIEHLPIAYDTNIAKIIEQFETEGIDNLNLNS